ncbi:MAG: hypothetical protein WA071_08635 [Undibacterium umbellatum]|uniref:DUF7684 family protein n=1 Tax=Undibacterium umbellatum TaxID=2762300 RepID=UPI003BB69266
MSNYYECENGRPLIITSREDVYKDIDQFEVIPCAVLLTAWNIEVVHSDYWRSLAIFLIKKGCTYFVCAGTYAENLHDLIDDIIFDQEGRAIATTYHEDETAEDVANFLVNATDIGNKSNSGLIAIFDNVSPGDELIKNFLLTVQSHAKRKLAIQLGRNFKAGESSY